MEINKLSGIANPNGAPPTGELWTGSYGGKYGDADPGPYDANVYGPYFYYLSTTGFALGAQDFCYYDTFNLTILYIHNLN